MSFLGDAGREAKKLDMDMEARMLSSVVPTSIGH